ncbi:MAG TPA: TonB-dependent receptor [Puia sp.]|jgi:hypothetical protein|nr:TonB-dependent receptor [Puia sp.]
MLKTEAILILLLGSFMWVNAQKPISISGVIRGADGVGLSKATLQLISSSDTLVTLSNENGEFILYGHPASQFTLKINMQGYKPFVIPVYVASDKKSVVVPPITLSLSYEELTPVMVMRSKPITILQDTLEYHADGFKVRPGAELERLMKQLPGIDWDTAGNVIIQGKTVNRIMIDGQEFTATNLKAALQNLPVGIIDKVQVIDDYGDQARLTGVKSGESEKVLNIVLKKDRHNGGIANLQTGGGSAGNHLTKIFSDLFKGSKQLTLNAALTNDNNAGSSSHKLIDLGYADTWNPHWSGNTYANLLSSGRSQHSSLNQDVFFPNTQTEQQENAFNSYSRRETNFGYALKFTAPNTLLRIGSSFTIDHSIQSTTDEVTSQEQDSGFRKVVMGNTQDSTKSHLLRLGSNLYFENMNPRSKNRLSLQLSFQSFQQRVNESDFANTNIMADSLSNISNQQYFIQTLNTRLDLMGNLHDYIPISKNSLLEIGYDWNYSHTDDGRLTQEPLGLTGLFNEVDSLSTNYRLTSTIQKLHAGYLLHSGKLNLDLGFDAQPGIQSGEMGSKGVIQKYHYFNWLPNTQASFVFSDHQKLNFQLRANTGLPSLQQLLPVIDVTNPQYPIKGNPNLLPSYSESTELHFEQSSLRPTQYENFGLGLTYSTTQNMIASSITHPQDSGVVVAKTTYVNLNGFNSLKLDYHYNFPSFWQQRIRVASTGNLSVNHSANLTDNILYTVSNLVWAENLQINLVIRDQIESTLSGGYQRSLSKYSAAGNGSPLLSSFYWGISSRHTFLQKWILNYTASQFWTSVASGSLKSNPVLTNASIRRDIFPMNQIAISFSVNNIFNQNVGVTQSVTPTSFTQSRTNLVGRYFTITVAVKFAKFKANQMNH